MWNLYPAPKQKNLRLSSEVDCQLIIDDYNPYRVMQGKRNRLGQRPIVPFSYVGFATENQTSISAVLGLSPAKRIAEIDDSETDLNVIRNALLTKLALFMQRNTDNPLTVKLAFYSSSKNIDVVKYSIIDIQ